MNVETILELVEALDEALGSNTHLYWKREFKDYHPDDDAQHILNELRRTWRQYKMEQLAFKQPISKSGHE